jgi:hypothetical protein
LFYFFLSSSYYVVQLLFGFLLVADPYTVHTLLLGLNDEVFRIRELVCVTIGRIIVINPTLVIPLLRKVVIRLFNEIKFGDVKTQERGYASVGICFFFFF